MASHQLQELDHHPGHIPIPFIIEIHVPHGIRIGQLIVNQAVVVRHMADQDVAVEGNAHSVAGQVVGRDLLLRLQLDPGREMAAVVAELFRPGPGVVAAFEQQESVLPERLQRHGREGRVQM